MMVLGWMYANGRGLERSDEMAGYFFGLAANQGHEQAKKMLRFVGVSALPMPDCMKIPVAEPEPWLSAPIAYKTWAGERHRGAAS